MRASQVATITVSLALAAGGITLLFSSCGDGSSDKDDDKGELTIDDDTKPFEATIGTLAVAFEAGTLPVGAKVSLTEVSTPAEFAAVAGASTASKAYDVMAKSKGGEVIAEAAKPFTIAISLDGAASLTADIERSAANLCMFLKTTSGKYVWHAADITIPDSKDKVSVHTNLFGTFMASYCGPNAIEGFTEGGSRSTDSVETVICDASTSAGFCFMVPQYITDADHVKDYTDLKNNCATLEGTITEKAACPGEGVAGTCDETDGDAYSATDYYTVKHTAEQAKTACQTKANEAKQGTTVTYTPASGTSEVLANTSAPKSKPFGCLRPATSICHYIDASNTSSTADFITECNGTSGNTIVKTCPEANFTSSCHFSTTGVKLYYYTGSVGGDAQSCEGVSNGNFSATYTAATP